MKNHETLAEKRNYFGFELHLENRKILTVFCSLKLYRNLYADKKHFLLLSLTAATP